MKEEKKVVRAKPEPQTLAEKKVVRDGVRTKWQEHRRKVRALTSKPLVIDRG